MVPNKFYRCYSFHSIQYFSSMAHSNIIFIPFFFCILLFAIYSIRLSIYHNIQMLKRRRKKKKEGKNIYKRILFNTIGNNFILLLAWHNRGKHDKSTSRNKCLFYYLSQIVCSFWHGMALNAWALVWEGIS